MCRLWYVNITRRPAKRRERQTNMATRFTSHRWDDQRDFPRASHLIKRAWEADGSAGGHFHLGDLTWQLHMAMPDADPPYMTCEAWDDGDGELAAFAAYYPKGNDLAFQFAPGLSGERELVAAMTAWGAAQSERWGKGGQQQLAMISTLDAPLRDRLAELGWTATDEPPMVMTEQSLDREIPDPGLPEGFTIRPVGGPAEWPDRVRIHQEVWAPSRVTDASYARLRSAAGYDPDLDLAVFAPDGEIAAYCVMWEMDGIGEFEPVGARERYRRRGLTRALLLTGLRRLQERGNRSAIVTCEDPDGGACSLYSSVGFAETGRWEMWQAPGRTG